MNLQGWGVRKTHRVIDSCLRVSARDVLNPVQGEGPEIGQVLPDLRRFLAAGKVHYAHLGDAPEYRRLCAAVAALHRAEPPSPEAAARAWWINLYNALIIHAVIAWGIRRSVWEDRGFFRRAAYVVGGQRVSADDIEHGILRGNRRHPLLPMRQFSPEDPRRRWTLPLDPRIHFALVCAANSCPAVNLYAVQQIDGQLDAAASAFINGGGVRVDVGKSVASLSQIFKWYRADFGGISGVLAFIARYLQAEEAQMVLRGSRSKIRYPPYDWTLNRAPL